MGTAVQTATIETKVPARMDRLPWSRFHWRVLIGLGTAWILDGLEVTIVGAVAARLIEEGSGIPLTAGDIGTAAAFYIVGACLGALFFGQLTDRFGRKKLFVLTLALYLAATVATAFAFAPWYFFLVRFLTGAGIGGEYAAINSAIDELMPARVRGRVDLVINGTYWLGSAVGSALALFFLSTAIFPLDLGWRFAFAFGALLGFAIMIVRRHVPESPRWLFIHGREDEAERIVDRIEREVREETGESLREPATTITVRQRETIPFRTIARTAFKVYPKRAVLGLALFIGQAFIYNGITFNLGTLFSLYYGIASGLVPLFIIAYALGNFLGPVTLGRLFDTVGRKPMITTTYLGSALVTLPLALVLVTAVGGEWLFLALVVVTFYLASAGASAAYLTVSEVFPMETRALAIAFFYAVGTGLGGIVGPLLFGQLIDSGERGLVALGFLISAAVMAMGGIAELILGVRAERTALEDIAKPLTAEEAEQDGEQRKRDTGEERSRYAEERSLRAHAERMRAEAAEHRARAARLRAEESTEAGADTDRISEEEALAEVYELRAQELDTRAMARAERTAAERNRSEAERATEEEGTEARARSDVHEARADMYDARASALTARAEGEDERLAHDERTAAEAEQRALAAEHRVRAAEHQREAGESEERAREVPPWEDIEPERHSREREDRIVERLARRSEHERSGIRRLRPGRGSLRASWTSGPDSVAQLVAEETLDREIETLVYAVRDRGPVSRDALARAVGARYWGPGRFGFALRIAIEEGLIQRQGRRTYVLGERGEEQL